MTTGRDQRLEEYLEACRNGDLESLRTLFESTKPPSHTSPAASIDQSKKAPSPMPLLLEAVRHRQKEVITVILEQYTRVSLGYTQSLVQTAIQVGDLEIIKLLQSYDQSFVRQEYDDRMHSALTDAIDSPDPQIPIFVIENGADIEIRRHLGGQALGYALQSDRPSKCAPEVIRALIEHGAEIGFIHVDQAIICQHEEALEVFLKEGVHGHFKWETVNAHREEILAKAAQTGNIALEKLVAELLSKSGLDNSGSSGLRGLSKRILCL